MPRFCLCAASDGDCLKGFSICIAGRDDPE
jgi:hypothetical protein